MHPNPITGIPNQQSLLNEQRCNQDTNITIEPIQQTAFEQAQLKTLHFQQIPNLLILAKRQGQPVVQRTNIENQSPYIKHLQNAATQAEQLSIRTDSSVIELFNQQQALKGNTNALISKFYDLQTQYKNDHFLANLQTYDGKGDRSFLDWITWDEKIPWLPQCPDIQLA